MEITTECAANKHMSPSMRTPTAANEANINPTGPNARFSCAASAPQGTGPSMPFTSGCTSWLSRRTPG
eukprot:436046-Alexandrium_andersonii.AAC.1